VNGDGFDVVYVFFGNTTGFGFATVYTAGLTFSDSTRFIINGAAADDNLGYSVSGVRGVLEGC
jgi:hypothetical protein